MGRLVNGTVTDNLQNKEIEKLKKEDDVVGKRLEVVSESLSDYYLANKAKWNQGTINYSSGVIVESTTAIYSDEINCTEGDLITTKNMDNSASENIIVVYYNAAGFVSSERGKLTYRVPSGVTNFRLNYRKTGNVNTNARVYVNNAIDEIKEDLNKNTYIIPTITNGRILNGGYAEIGNVIVVNIRFKPTTTNPLIYLPTPATDYVGVQVNCVEDKTKFTHNALSKQYGTLDIYPVDVNNTYDVNFVYLKQ